MFGMWDVGCGMFAGMWDVDLQNAVFSKGCFNNNSVVVKKKRFMGEIVLEDFLEKPSEGLINFRDKKVRRDLKYAK